MKKFTIISVFCLPFVLISGMKSVLAGEGPPVFETPPNIVLFYVDDLGYADLGSYGAVGVETPNVDRRSGRSARSTATECRWPPVRARP